MSIPGCFPTPKGRYEERKMATIDGKWLPLPAILFSNSSKREKKDIKQLRSKL